PDHGPLGLLGHVLHVLHEERALGLVRHGLGEVVVHARQRRLGHTLGQVRDAGAAGVFGALDDLVGARRAHEQEHVLVLHEGLARLHGLAGVVPVVGELDHHSPPVDGLADPVEVELLVLVETRRRGAGAAGRTVHADHDGVVGDTGAIVPRRGCRPTTAAAGAAAAGAAGPTGRAAARPRPRGR